MAPKTAKEAKKIADRKVRVKRTINQAGILALVAVYPTVNAITDWGALKAAIPALGFVALQALITDLYNRVSPAK